MEIIKLDSRKEFKADITTPLVDGFTEIAKHHEYVLIYYVGYRITTALWICPAKALDFAVVD